MKHPRSYDSTPETRERMAKVKLKEGKAETLLAKALWHKGYRYRKNDKSLPGSPDIAIRRHRIAVFVDGEFWHGKDWISKKDRIKHNRGYWTEKIGENIARDNANDQALRQIDWMPLHFWEKDVLKSVDGCVAQIGDAILERLIEQTEDAGPPPEKEQKR